MWRDLFTSKFNSQSIFSQDLFNVITKNSIRIANLKIYRHMHTSVHFIYFFIQELLWAKKKAWTHYPSGYPQFIFNTLPYNNIENDGVTTIANWNLLNLLASFRLSIFTLASDNSWGNEGNPNLHEKEVFYF